MDDEWLVRYFHKAPRRSALPQTLTASLTAAGGYRGGTRKGLDLTFGMPSTVTSPYFASLGSSASSRAETSTVGGILLRTIRCVADGRVISGPSLLVDEILRTSDAPSIASLVKQKWNDDISAFPATSSYREVNLWLKRRSPSGPEPKPPIHTSPRIGLDLSNPETTDSFSHPRVIYVARPYRFFTNPHLLTANGRWQTLYGLYKELLLSPKHAEDERAMIQKLAKLTGLKLPTVERFLDDYKQGYESGKLKSFIGSMGKGASASSSNYLRMMGTLDKAQNV
ncbi:hypothetical protein GLOTRDRAFT_34618 [Gloeophyllum trabeum ATCC 11539]|uniref:Uncharacterized protein n=1 Tax=Gloeophyllum trabeum (strain ATCC 11539 / FP-39264 / Madison 617) TaxID=670483 RepID=S7QI22_GLOTA|nr:uncharacterized protein GLOTRDRAFT_34618 [Gloeophyllum trabeum ATCC 11539]EPQ58842.1 hypothetical protein GLOTRDRAFT_34618 [Gloeophyllum trabeum ATCC 11539]